jgi:hypothetical protein
VTLYFIGWVLIMVVFVVTQTRFYDAHQRIHHRWRPRNTPWMLSYSYPELRALVRESFRRNEDSTVEKARRIYLAVLILGGAYLVVGFPIAVLTLGAS